MWVTCAGVLTGLPLADAPLVAATAGTAAGTASVLAAAAGVATVAMLPGLPLADAPLVAAAAGTALGIDSVLAPTAGVAAAVLAAAAAEVWGICRRHPEAHGLFSCVESVCLQGMYYLR